MLATVTTLSSLPRPLYRPVRTMRSDAFANFLALSDARR